MKIINNYYLDFLLVSIITMLSLKVDKLNFLDLLLKFILDFVIADLKTKP